MSTEATVPDRVVALAVLRRYLPKPGAKENDGRPPPEAVRPSAVRDIAWRIAWHTLAGPGF